MDYSQILALLAALSGQPDPAWVGKLKAGGHDPSTPVTVTSCPRPLPVGEIEGVTMLCGTVSVPEDHAQPHGKHIKLYYTILKSSSQFPEPDPLVYFQGGPGGSIVTSIPLAERLFKQWRLRRDIITFDQRSAGISGSSVNCYNALAANALTIAIASVKPDSAKAKADKAKLPKIMSACIAELTGGGVDLAKYNTTQNAYDVRSIMTALGFTDYNIYGISYGTKLALEVMRVAPKGVRSVIIDGVAPPWIHLYNSFAMKTDEAIQYVVDQCAADAKCNAAYPDLGRIFTELLNKAAAGQLLVKGEKAPVQLVVFPVQSRNGKYDLASITRYIPAYIYELYRGKETPTVEMILQAKGELPKPGEAEVTKAAAKLTKEQQALTQQLLDDVAIQKRAATGMSNAVDALRSSVESSKTFGPIARMFDQELTKAMVERLRPDKSQLQNVIADYVAMQNAKPAKETLRAFVDKYLTGDAHARLSALIASMSPAEIDGSFAIIKRDSYEAQKGFLGGVYLDIYACQEDIPFNSLEGYRELTAKLRYPHLGNIADSTAKFFFDGCGVFTPHPRKNWHEPVASDIPTLSFGGVYDVQTPASWAKAAIEKLANAQAFVIPEAGHGAVIYQQCVADMGVAFTDNPRRKFDNACVESIKIDWYMAPWLSSKN